MATLNGVVSIWKNDGDGSFSRRSQFEVGVISQGLTGADLDSDGDLDVSSADFAGLFLLRNRGDGAFDDALRLLSETTYTVASADLDGDGAIDLLAVGEGSGRTTSILWNEGDATFPVSAAFHLGKETEMAAPVDLDGDGDLDLVAADYHFESQGLPVLLNGGRRRFTGAPEIATGGHTITATAGDLDGDGFPDLAFTLPESSGIGIVLNRSNPALSRDNDLDGIPDECEGAVFRRADTDADGSLNLVDAVFLIQWLFKGGPAPPCLKSADAVDDGVLDVSDILFILRFLFRGGPEPGAPFHACGGDPSGDGLGCESFPPCGQG
jgi:hypothetical protein